MRPLVSIITPTMGRADTIASAIDSVNGQDYKSVEHIVIDGGSDDGTDAVLATYPHLRVVAGPDTGVYDAINKGLALARGTIIGHLNSDDLYLPGTFGAVVRAFEENPSADSVAGGAEVVDAARGRTMAVHDREQAKKLRPRDAARGVAFVNARFFRRSLYDRVGVYDSRYRLAADKDFLLRALIAGMQTVALDRVVYRYRYHSGSLTVGPGGGGHQTSREFIAIARSYMGPESPADVRRECRRWHAREVGRLLAKDPRGAADAFREDAGWLLRFGAQALPALVGRTARRLRGRSWRA